MFSVFSSCPLGMCLSENYSFRFSRSIIKMRRWGKKIIQVRTQWSQLSQTTLLSEKAEWRYKKKIFSSILLYLNILSVAPDLCLYARAHSIYSIRATCTTRINFSIQMIFYVVFRSLFWCGSARWNRAGNYSPQASSSNIYKRKEVYALRAHQHYCIARNSCCLRSQLTLCVLHIVCCRI